MKRLLVIGAGGHAKVIVDILQQNMEYEVVGLIDQPGTEGFWNALLIVSPFGCGVPEKQSRLSLPYPYPFGSPAVNVILVVKSTDSF